MNRLRTITAALVCFQLILQPSVPALASSVGAGLGLTAPGEVQGASGSEYVSGNYQGAILMPVNLWGAIGKPGIHHVPSRTDLVTLLSLAGGPSSEAELDEVLIKRRSGGEEQVIRVDAEEILSTAGVHSPTLQANDIVIVPRRKPAVSTDVLSVLSVTSSVIGLILAGIAVNNSLK